MKVQFDFELINGNTVYVTAKKKGEEEFDLRLQDDNGVEIPLTQIDEDELDSMKEKAEEEIFFKTQELDFRD